MVSKLLTPSLELQSFNQVIRRLPRRVLVLRPNLLRSMILFTEISSEPPLFCFITPFPSSYTHSRQDATSHNLVLLIERKVI